MFAVLSFDHSQLELQAGLCQELYRLQPSNCRPSFGDQLCLSAGEGNDALRRAAVVDGVGTELLLQQSPVLLVTHGCTMSLRS